MPSWLPGILNLGTTYKKYFEVLPALTDELKDEVYRIRHQVYCEELKFEPERPDKRESDEYDAQSKHLLIRSVQTGQYIGCTRIVRARADDPQPLMPFEKSCEQAIDRSIADPRNLPRNSIAEISRLAVIAAYRKRKGDSKAPISISENDFGTFVQPRFPYIPVALYLGTLELARLSGIDTIFVLTEPRLASHFRKLGVDIQPIGSPIEHRGKRVPSMMSASRILNGMRFFFKPLYRTIASEVARGLDPQQAAGNNHTPKREGA
jgi:N-acyl amino acid synthase of PEP-CTERM/exosortase system